MSRPEQAISEIVQGTKQITPETAYELAQAFGTSAAFWMNLESNYRLHLAEQRPKDDSIARRGQLYDLAPLREMSKRGWIELTEDVEELQRRVLAVLGMTSLTAVPTLAANLRHSAERTSEVKAEIAWAKRVEWLAREQSVASYDRERLYREIPTLLRYAQKLEDVSQVPQALLALGVHFLFVPHLAKTYLDGAAFWVAEHPVVALTLRHDRLDYLWFTLLHELADVLLEHPGVYLDQLYKDHGVLEEALMQVEAAANQRARDWLLDPEALEAFRQNAQPHFSREAIETFAAAQARHPTVVLGRLQHEGVVGYSHLRSWLSQFKVRAYLEPWKDVAVPSPA